MKIKMHSPSKSILHGIKEVPHGGSNHAASYPENLLEDILRSRSLHCNLEALGYPHFMVRLYRKALHSRSVMNGL